MISELYSSYLYVNLPVLKDNVRAIMADLGPEVEVIPVLKDDAYGLGLIPVAEAISEVENIRAFAVAQVSECARLREAGVEKDILLLGGIPTRHVPYAIEYDAIMTVGRLGLLPLIAREARRQGKVARVHLKIETGLHRIGLMPGEELARGIAELAECGGAVEVDGAYSHFLDIQCLGVDNASERQLMEFERALRQLKAAGIAPKRVHMCQSAASEYMPEARFNAARIGRRLYMDHQLRPHAPGSPGAVREVASWRASVTNVRTLRAGDTLGYGGGFRLERDSVIATICVGYGDGLNLQLAERYAPVLINGRRARLMHTCMDQCFADVTDIPCQVDDVVTFFGEAPDGSFLSSQEVAQIAGSEGVSLTANLFPRVKRVYIES